MKSAPLAAAIAATLLAAGCRGTVPQKDAPPEQAIGAILIGGRMILPTGESKSGRTAIGFESEGGRRAEVYKLPVPAAENLLYLIEPGVYRLSPTRGFFGGYQAEMTVAIGGRAYRAPFPREILRLPPFTIKPYKILALGILEAEVLRALPGQEPQLRVRLDDGVAARRSLVQAVIREMMDPSRPAEARDSAVAWSRQLQNTLLELQAEEDKRPLYTPAP